MRDIRNFFLLYFVVIDSSGCLDKQSETVQGKIRLHTAFFYNIAEQFNISHCLYGLRLLKKKIRERIPSYECLLMIGLSIGNICVASMCLLDFQCQLLLSWNSLQMPKCS